MSRSSGARVLPRLRQFPRSFLIEKISQFSEAHAGYAYPALVACAACATRRQLSLAMIVLSLHPWSVRIHKRRLTKNKARKCRILSGSGEKNDLIFFSLFPAAQLPSITILSCTHIISSASRCLPAPSRSLIIFSIQFLGTIWLLPILSVCEATIACIWRKIFSTIPGLSSSPVQSFHCCLHFDTVLCFVNGLWQFCNCLDFD